MHQILLSWQTFYEILGASAGALIGLQFVVIALMASLQMRPDAGALNAFGTPSVVHLSQVLAISAIMCAPWPSLVGASVALIICGICGLGYACIVVRRTRRQTSYKPQLDDWLWYALLPCVMYLALTLAALLLLRSTTTGPLRFFIIAAASLGLLLIAIRNAWDSMTHIIVTSRHGNAKPPQ